MKNQKKQLVTLIVFLGFMVIAYFGIGYYNDQEAKKEEGNQIYIAEFSSENMVAFSYDYEGNSYSFTKTEENWAFDGDTSLDMDETSINNMLLGISSLMAEQELTEYESLETYGLDTPSKKIVITLSDGQVLSFQIGDYNEMLQQYYLMKEESNSLYLVDNTLYNTFDVSYENFIVVEEETEESTAE